MKALWAAIINAQRWIGENPNLLASPVYSALFPDCAPQPKQRRMAIEAELAALELTTK